ncbi:hypothetical protein ACFLZI_03980, partial [Nitrospirota bacterium]
MAGLIFTYTGFLLLNRDHTAITNSAVYMPLILFLLDRLKSAPSLKGALYLSLTVAFQFFAGNFQICFYTYMISGIFILFTVLSQRNKASFSFVAYGALGFFAGSIMFFPQLISTMELSKGSWMGATKIYRGYDYFSYFHAYGFMLPSLLLPKILNGIGVHDLRPFNTGTATFIFALCTMFAMIRHDKRVLLWSIIAAVGLVLALNEEIEFLNRFMFQVPVYNIIRVHGRNLVELSLALSMLTAIGLDKALYSNNESTRRFSKIMIASAASLLIITIVSVAALPYFDNEMITTYLTSKGASNPGVIGNITLSSSKVIVPLAIMSFIAALGILIVRHRSQTLKYMAVAIIVGDIIYCIGGFGSISAGSIKSSNLCENEPFYEFQSDTDYHRVANINH